MAQTWPWRGSPGPLADLQELFSEVLDDFVEGLPVGEGRFPPVELRRTPEGYRLIAAVPGVDREDVQLSVEGQTVMLEGERRAPEAPDDAEPLRRERGAGRFRRTVRLRDPVDTANVTARLERGLLMVDLPRPEEQRPREITIQVEEGT